tara:strand:+ start:387 stop:2762 length:2376 start_codon:yes stop_codon:yes gene_type:complete
MNDNRYEKSFNNSILNNLLTTLFEGDLEDLESNLEKNYAPGLVISRNYSNIENVTVHQIYSQYPQEDFGWSGNGINELQEQKKEYIQNYNKGINQQMISLSKELVQKKRDILSKNATDNSRIEINDNKALETLLNRSGNNSMDMNLLDIIIMNLLENTNPVEDLNNKFADNPSNGKMHSMNKILYDFICNDPIKNNVECHENKYYVNDIMIKKKDEDKTKKVTTGLKKLYIECKKKDFNPEGDLHELNIQNRKLRIYFLDINKYSKNCNNKIKKDILKLLLEEQVDTIENNVERIVITFNKLESDQTTRNISVLTNSCIRELNYHNRTSGLDSKLHSIIQFINYRHLTFNLRKHYLVPKIIEVLNDEEQEKIKKLYNAEFHQFPKIHGIYTLKKDRLQPDPICTFLGLYDNRLIKLVNRQNKLIYRYILSNINYLTLNKNNNFVENTDMYEYKSDDSDSTDYSTDINLLSGTDELDDNPDEPDDDDDDDDDDDKPSDSGNPDKPSDSGNPDEPSDLYSDKSSDNDRIYNPSDFIYFYSLSKEITDNGGRNVKLLSNFATKPVVIDGRSYDTGEHAYHGTKYLLAAKATNLDADRVKQLKQYAKDFESGNRIGKEPKDAKKEGGPNGGLPLTPDEIDRWNLEQDNIQRRISEYKYEKYDDVKTALESTNDKYLIHFSKGAKPKSYWEGKIDKNTQKLVGNNKLGKIWMEIRARTNKTSNKPSDESTKSNNSLNQSTSDKPVQPENYKRYEKLEGGSNQNLKITGNKISKQGLTEKQRTQLRNQFLDSDSDSS